MLAPGKQSLDGQWLAWDGVLWMRYISESMVYKGEEIAKIGTKIMWWMRYISESMVYKREVPH